MATQEARDCDVLNLPGTLRVTTTSQYSDDKTLQTP